MRAIGLMSGTSADGIDAALIDTDGKTISATGAWLTTPMAPGLRSVILAVMADPARAEHDALEGLEEAITEAHAKAVKALLARTGLAARDIDVVGFHGQTVLHRPERRLTRQLGDGAMLARRLGIPVVNRFRHADVEAGGQGAPLVPVFHEALCAGMERPLAVLNLGGVGNVTYLGPDGLLAFDTGPGNALIDDWVRRHTGAAFDEDGAIAARGTVDAACLARLLDHQYFRRTPPKSLDRHDFTLDAVESLSLEDGAATLAAFTARAVARAREHFPEKPRRWLVAGGGRHNAVLMQGLANALGVPVEPVEAVGWQGDALEAQAFGFLAVRSLHGLALSLPGTTGVPRPMPGGVVHQIS
jgi:anhydro-N-acetylmuramic acid kinase